MSKQNKQNNQVQKEYAQAVFRFLTTGKGTLSSNPSIFLTSTQ